MTTETTTTEGIDIYAWIHDVIDGAGGMNSFEDREMVIWNAPDREAAAAWIIRCLANPDCEGSRAVLDSIERRRMKKGEMAR